MDKFFTALLALSFSTAASTAPATAQPANAAPSGVFGAPVLVADGDDNNDGDEDNGNGRRQNCTNPAGHQRGWCRNGNRNRNGGYYGGNSATISGTVLGVHDGYVADFRTDSGQFVRINERALLRVGAPLQPGAHYVLNGFYASNGAFVAEVNNYANGYPNNGYPNGNYPNNGYPNGGGNASIRGVVTSISGNRVTLLQGVLNTVTIDDQQALNNGAAQNLYVGRTVTAYGFWSGNVFYATSIG